MPVPDDAGSDPMGIGLAGSLVGTLIGRAWEGENYQAHWIMSIIGAVLLLVLFQWAMG
jgi:uncharacterized membrane protein YeaQ/YmgE (transglycosylase-associated protein family)